MLSTKNVAEENRVNKTTDARAITTKMLGGFAAIAGVGAVIASSCCVFPLLLAAVGASAGVFAAFQYLAEWKYALLGVASVSLVGSWYTWWKKRSADCCSATQCATNNSRITTMLLLCVSTVLIMLAYSWEHIEPVLLKIIKGHI